MRFARKCTLGLKWQLSAALSVRLNTFIDSALAESCGQRYSISYNQEVSTDFAKLMGIMRRDPKSRPSDGYHS